MPINTRHEFGVEQFEPEPAFVESQYNFTRLLFTTLIGWLSLACLGFLYNSLRGVQVIMLTKTYAAHRHNLWDSILGQRP